MKNLNIFSALCFVLASCGEEKTVEDYSKEVEKEVAGGEEKRAKEEAHWFNEGKNDLALKGYRARDEAGDADAQYTMGSEYVITDRPQAFKWFRKSAEQGNQFAQVALAYFFEWGDQVPMDKVEAAKWYRKAAEQGNQSAKLWLVDNAK